MGIFIGFILAPAATLVLWYAMPIFKDLMISVTETWGAAVGLDGLSLIIANSLPLIVPVACVGGIVAGFIFLAKTTKVG